MIKGKWWWTSAGVAIVFAVLIAPLARADGTAYFTDINNTFYSQGFINDCYWQSKPNEVRKDSVDQPWVWMKPGGNVDIGRYTAPSNGLANCDNQAVMGNAYTTFLKYAEYADSDAFMKALGYTITQTTIPGSNCKAKTDGTVACSGPLATVDTYTLGGKAPNMAAIQNHTPPQADPALFFALNTVFTGQCVATTGMTIQHKIVVEEPAGSGKYTTQTVDVIIKTITQGSYSGGGGTGGTGSAPANLSDYNYNAGSISCKDLSAKLDGLTAAVVAFNTKNPTNAITSANSASSLTPSNASTGASKPTCTVEGIGWIVCPVMKFMATLNDGLFGFIAGQLEFKIEFLKTDSNAYKAWLTFQGIANIMFIIAFIIIVFSQVTSFGISNYGIKKLLPKLIVVAILVNISYYLCQLAVDISNLLGLGIKALFDGLKPATASSAGVDWGGIIIVVLAAGAATIGLLLAVSVPVIIAAFLSLASAALIIFAQKALVILLTALSPIAFAAMLLPNTEKLFKKWRELFTAMLILFPTVSLLFGAGGLASAILMGSDPSQTPLEMKVAALGAAVLPLFAIIPLLQNSLKGTGALGDKLSGLNRRANAGIGKKIKDSSMLGAYKGAWDRNLQKKRALIMSGQYSGRGPLARVASRVNAGINARTGNVGEQVKRMGMKLAADIDAENITAANAELANARFDHPLSALRGVAMGGDAHTTDGKVISGKDSHTRVAAAMRALDQGDHDTFAAAWDAAAASGDVELQKAFADMLAKSGSKPGYISAGALAAMRQGNAQSHDDILRAQVTAGAYSPQKLVDASREELNFVERKIRGDAAAEGALHQAAADVNADPQLRKDLGKGRDRVLAWGMGAGTFNGAGYGPGSPGYTPPTP